MSLGWLPWLNLPNQIAKASLRSDDPTSIHDSGHPSSIATPTLSTPPQLPPPCSSSALPSPRHDESPPAPSRPAAPSPPPSPAVGTARELSHDVPLTLLQGSRPSPRRPGRAALRRRRLGTRPMPPVCLRAIRSLIVCCARIAADSRLWGRLLIRNIFIEIKNESDLLPPGAQPGTVPTDAEQATGLERLEILGKMQGIDIFDMRPLDASRLGT